MVNRRRPSFNTPLSVLVLRAIVNTAELPLEGGNALGNSCNVVCRGVDCEIDLGAIGRARREFGNPAKLAFDAPIIRKAGAGFKPFT